MPQVQVRRANSETWSSPEWTRCSGWKVKEERGTSNETEICLFVNEKLQDKHENMMVQQKLLLKSLTIQYQCFHILFPTGVRNANTHKIMDCPLQKRRSYTKPASFCCVTSVPLHLHWLSRCSLGSPASGTPGSTVQRSRDRRRSGTAAADQAGWRYLLQCCCPFSQTHRTLWVDTSTSTEITTAHRCFLLN